MLEKEEAKTAGGMGGHDGTRTRAACGTGNTAGAHVAPMRATQSPPPPSPDNAFPGKAGQEEGRDDVPGVGDVVSRHAAAGSGECLGRAGGTST